MKKIIIFLSVVLLCSCSATKKLSNTFIVVGHESTFDGDTINIVRRTDRQCKKSPVYSVGTVICQGKFKIQ